jgi:2-alkenal reductase
LALWLYRLAILWLLALATAWVAQPYLQAWLYGTEEPRVVTPRGDLAEYEKAAIDVFEARSPSVALIVSVSEVRGIFGGAETRAGLGSGFVWDAAGHVVTNNHVVEGADEVGIRLGTDQTVRARIVGRAPDYDLAVLQPQGRLEPAPPIPVGASQGLEVGQTVFAIGNPFGLSRSLSSGIISALGRHLPTSGGREIQGVIQTDAAINPGNSGGPLLDSAGRLIGVNTAIASQSGVFAGVGFAVPVDVVNRIVPQLIETGHAPRPGIGIAALDETVAAGLDAPGVVVAEVFPDSAAARAGLRGIDRGTGRLGDVITAVAGKRVRTVADLAAALEEAGIGKTVQLTILRDGQERTVEVEVADIG